VHDHRQLALAQLVFEKELGLTPLAFAALRGSQQPPLDLVGMMAAQSDAAETTAAWSPVRIDSLLEQTGFEPSRPFDSVVVDRGLNPSGNELASLLGAGRFGNGLRAPRRS
jgi:hypothetical protein